MNPHLRKDRVAAVMQRLGVPGTWDELQASLEEAEKYPRNLDTWDPEKAIARARRKLGLPLKTKPPETWCVCPRCKGLGCPRPVSPSKYFEPIA